jgi:integrase
MRGRQAKPWYWKERDVWCITRNGKRVILARGKANRKEAYRRFLELAPEETRSVTARVTGKEVCDLYVEHAESNLKPKTYRWYKMILDRFGNTVRLIDANEVQPKHVTDHIKAHKNEWNVTTRCGVITAIKRAWAWAEEEGHITLNPLRKIKKPRPQRRDEIPDDREVKVLLKTAKPELRLLLTFVYHTGCRPGEAAMIERRHVNLVNREVRFKIGEDKTSGRTGKPRVIHLNDAALQILTALMSVVAPGPLFRNSRGNPWTEFAISLGIRKIRERTGLDERSVAYALRHHWATDALARGVPLATVAEMMGNSPEIVAKVYSHLSDKKSLLLDAANAVRPPEQRAS